MVADRYLYGETTRLTSSSPLLCQYKSKDALIFRGDGITDRVFGGGQNTLARDPRSQGCTHQPWRAAVAAAARAVLIDGCKGTARRRCPPSYPPPLFPSFPPLDRFRFGGAAFPSLRILINPRTDKTGTEGGRVCARKSVTADMTDGPRVDKGTFFTKFCM